MHILYLKTHNVTGKQYLGYYSSRSRVKFKNYKGSGVHWKRHYKKHGYDVTTEVLCQASTSVERDGRLLAPEWFDKVCLEFSKMYNVVENDNFANLCHETGSAHTLLGYKTTQEVKEKIGAKNRGQKRTQEVINKMLKAWKNRDPNLIKRIWRRASEAGDYERSYETFNRVRKSPNHRDYQLVSNLIKKHTVKE